jgi:hypothetical protein
MGNRKLLWFIPMITSMVLGAAVGIFFFWALFFWYSGSIVKMLCAHGTCEGSSTETVKILEKRDALQALPLGKIVLLAPKAMKVGDIRQVDANVGIDVPLEALQKALRPGDQSLEGEARLAAKMSAVLVGVAFTIKPLSPEQQTVASGFPTVWSWSVEAREQGEQELEATLYALLPDAPQRVDSYAQKISVSVHSQTWGEWLEAFGKQFDAAKTVVVSLFGLATFAAGWFGLTLNRRRKMPQSRSRARASPGRRL